jgi:hypothetical protein
MKAILKSLKEDSCRVRDITENEKQTFSDLSHIQRYFSALDRFKNPFNYFEKNIELPSRYYINEFLSGKTKSDKIKKSIIFDIKTQEAVSRNTFVKTVHLLNPIDYIKAYYPNQEHPFIPYSEDTIKYTVDLLHSSNNQAYVDTVANYVLGRFRELDLTPHCVEFYGALTGISASYNYNISDDYDSYKNKKWFWRGIKQYDVKFHILMDDENIEKIDDLKDIYDEIVTCPFNEEELDIDDLDSDIESELNELLNIDTDIQSVKSFSSMKSYNFEDTNNNSEDTKEDNSEEDTNSDEDNSEDTNSDEDNSDDDNSDDDDDTDLEIFLTLNNIPVIKIFQEAQEGTLDELLDEEILDDQLHGTQGWEARFIAWLFQVVATLTFLQATISFTHNDLHSNNILWRKTDKKFLYYRQKSGQLWRVPTYGRIFSIIDFGRSVFKIGKQQWISSDLYPENDASDQYNFGPFYDKTRPKVLPNFSFDLARLSVSLLDGLFADFPEKRKGKALLLSKEDDWEMYETKSPLFNLLWSWTVDDNNMTIYEDKHGEPKFPGFDLYIHIAHNLHNAVPKEQLSKPQFTQYKWNKKAPKGEKVYSLEC